MAQISSMPAAPEILNLKLATRGFSRQGATELLNGQAVTHGNDLARAVSESSTGAQSASLQYLSLQQNMQKQSQVTSLLSNMMKIFHDTTKNIINNLR